MLFFNEVMEVDDLSAGISQLTFHFFCCQSSKKKLKKSSLSFRVKWAERHFFGHILADLCFWKRPHQCQVYPKGRVVSTWGSSFSLKCSYSMYSGRKACLKNYSSTSVGLDQRIDWLIEGQHAPDPLDAPGVERRQHLGRLNGEDLRSLVTPWPPPAGHASSLVCTQVFRVLSWLFYWKGA